MCVFVMFSTTTSLQFIGQIHSQLKKKKIYYGRILQRALNQLQSHLILCCDQHQQVVHLLSGYEVSKGCGR